MKDLKRIFALFCLVTAAHAFGEEKPEKPAEKEPPALTHYMGRAIAQTMHFKGAPWLVRESREREEECSTLLKILNVQAGQTICDMGCGNGFYAVKLAKIVGERGKVIGVDIQKEMLAMLRTAAKDNGVNNIEPVLGTTWDPKLAENSCDMILCVDVYHEFDHPIEMLAAMRKALKPDGRMVLVEFRTEDDNVPIKPEHKMSKAQINKEIPPAGFKLVEEFDKLPWQHVMFFKKSDVEKK